MLISIIRQVKLFYSTSDQIQNLASRISQTNFYYQLAKLKIEKQRLKDERGPFNLVIETSNFCNARCLMCPYPRMKRVKKIMDKKTFTKILERISQEKLSVNKVFFSGLGEPLSDPDLVSRIARVKELGFWVRLYTNASLLTPEISRQLVELGLNEVNISFNGVTPEQYRKIMSLDFAKTVANINCLIEQKRKFGKRLPKTQISLIAIEENRQTVERHFQNWVGKVDSVTVSRAHEWGGKIKSKIKNQKLKMVYPCRSLWHTFNIDSQGNFVICCRDFESKYILGNIQTHSFAEIQRSTVLKHFRRLHLSYSQWKLPKICQFCNFPYQEGVEWFLPRSID